jgi:hypothetical protein
MTRVALLAALQSTCSCANLRNMMAASGLPPTPDDVPIAVFTAQPRQRYWTVAQFEADGPMDHAEFVKKARVLARAAGATAIIVSTSVRQDGLSAGEVTAASLFLIAFAVFAGAGGHVPSIQSRGVSWEARRLVADAIVFRPEPARPAPTTVPEALSTPPLVTGSGPGGALCTDEDVLAMQQARLSPSAIERACNP